MYRYKSFEITLLKLCYTSPSSRQTKVHEINSLSQLQINMTSASSLKNKPLKTRRICPGRRDVIMVYINDFLDIHKGEIRIKSATLRLKAVKSCPSLA